jgi:5'-3' exonuclease
MGIPYYFNTITKTYSNILLYSIANKKIDNFFIDFNGIVHTAANKVEEKTNENINNKTWELVDESVKIVKPEKMVHICADGVAPVAKMNQQRKRRYLSIFRQNLSKSKESWDRNCISPGTQFSKELNIHIRNCIRENKSKLIYYFNSSDDVGEGEHKIFARIANIPINDVNIIHGLDADLIMLSLMSHHPNIYLMRENDKGEDNYIYLDIDALRVGILKDLQSTYTWGITDDIIQDPYSDIAKNIIESYVVLCFILGNDFLPHIPSLCLKNKGHDRILNAAKKIQYDEMNESLVNSKENTINIDLLVKIFQILELDENEIMKRVNEEYIRKRPYHGMDEIESYPIKDENKDKLAKTLLEKGNRWRPYYYKELFDCDLYDSKIIVNSSMLFIKGILWTYAYYKRKPELMNDIWYYYPYEYSPTLLDLANYLQSTIDIWKNIKVLDDTEIKKMYVKSDIQLLCILPSKSLPTHLQKYANKEEYGLKHMFPKEYKIHTYLKTHLWECCPILPYLDIEYITTLV